MSRRKLSFPASLHANLLGLASTSGETRAARRRFSDAVSRKLSHTIGWRATPVPTQDVVEQGKTLCGRYIRGRLKRSSLFSRECGLPRVRTAPYVVREVFPQLASVGHELERLHPKLYSGVARQASASPGGVLACHKSASCVLSAVARELFKHDVTWAKVVSLFAVAGGLAVDCVRQGHPDYVHSLPEAMAEVLEDELGPWVVSNGGWQGLLAHYKSPTKEAANTKYASVLGAVFIAIFLVALSLRVFL